MIRNIIDSRSWVAWASLGLLSFIGLNGSLLAETGLTIIAGNGVAGFRDGTEAQFNKPIRLAPYGDGKILVADITNHAIRVVSRDGVVSTIAGGPDKKGHQDGIADEAMFSGPHGVAISAEGIIAVAGASSHLVRLITPIEVNGDTRYEVSTVAGVYETSGMKDGPADQALFNSPHAVAWDSEGGLLVVDIGNSRIRRIKDGMVTTVLGPKEEGMSMPIDMSLTVNGEILLADAGNNTVLHQLADGQLVTVKASTALKVPHGVASDSAGNVYVAEIGSHQVTRIAPTGEVTVLAGTGTAGSGPQELDKPAAVLVHDGLLWIADLDNHRISVLPIEF